MSDDVFIEFYYEVMGEGYVLLSTKQIIMGWLVVYDGLPWTDPIRWNPGLLESVPCLLINIECGPMLRRICALPNLRLDTSVKIPTKNRFYCYLHLSFTSSENKL